MFEADDPYTLYIPHESPEVFRKRIINELVEFEKNKRKEELELRATSKDERNLIRILASQHGFVNRIKRGFGFPSYVIISRFISNLKCPNLHEEDIKNYYENNKDKDINNPHIPYIYVTLYSRMLNEERNENHPVIRNIEKWKEKYKEREKNGFFSLPSCDESLPIIKEADKIIDGIKSNRVFIITGETGCGKSTQVPQMILNDKELGPESCIICCQPRRLCAVGLAERVAEERGEKVGETVSYSIRFDTNLSETTQLEYVTTGLLLRRLNNDPELKGISHLIIDEAHERDQFLDFLLVYVKDKLLKLNPQIHIIIMSATLQIEKITNYFDNPKIIYCIGKMYDVKEYWLDEIKAMVEETTETKYDDDDIDDKSNKPLHKSDELTPENDDNDLNIDNNLIVDICQYIIINSSCGEDAILIFLPGWNEILELEEQLKKNPICESCNILPLHSNLDQEDQNKIFKKVSDVKVDDNDKSDARKIILSTNVAETSLTINEVKYVIDAGLMKVNKYDSETQITSLTTELISKANVKQRKGRAGRTKEGECYHLYTKEQYDKMNENPIPEIQRIVLDEVILRARSLDRIHNYKIKDFLSKLLDPPDIEMIDNGIELLQSYGALDSNENLTKIGVYFNDIPILPKYAYLLLLALFFRCFDSVLSIICILNVNDIFKNASKKKEREIIKEFKRKNSKAPNDFIFLLRVLKEVENKNKKEERVFYCKENKILLKKVDTIYKMKNDIFQSMVKSKIISNSDYERITENDRDLSLVTQVIAMALFPQVGIHVEKSPVFMFNEKSGGLVHPSSVIQQENYKMCDETKLLIFNEVNRDNKNKIYFKYDAIVNPLTILLCSVYNFEIQEEDKGRDVMVRLSENFKMSVNKDYYQYVNFLKKMMKYLFHKFIDNPSQIIGTEKYADFFNVIKTISRF